MCGAQVAARHGHIKRFRNCCLVILFLFCIIFFECVVVFVHESIRFVGVCLCLMCEWEFLWVSVYPFFFRGQRVFFGGFLFLAEIFRSDLGLWSLPTLEKHMERRVENLLGGKKVTTRASDGFGEHLAGNWEGTAC